MGLAYWLAVAALVINVGLFGYNLVNLLRSRGLQRALDHDRDEAIAELDAAARLHFTLTWILVNAARSDSLPWWRMWSASVAHAMTEAATAAATDTPAADTPSRPGMFPR
jgi:hypothetical protein